MSRRSNPLLYMPAFALSGAAHALGLGEIHVTSALNEPLSGQIDIVGATPEDLIAVHAAIANHETFQRYNADRPAFLSSTSFKLGKDNQGRPVLLIKSTEAFTEPLVNFLVDLQWSSGELVREYTLLLDPAISRHMAYDAPSAQPNVDATPIADGRESFGREAPNVTPPARAPAASAAADASRRFDESSASHYTVAARDTLGRIARRAGAHTDADLMVMMVGIYRANPAAFNGNINRLRIGATLALPGREDLQAISTHDAAREVHAQMLAWHAATGANLAASPARTPLRSAPVATPAAGGDLDSRTIESLELQVQSLAKALDALRRAQEHDHGGALHENAVVAGVAGAAEAPPDAVAAPEPAANAPAPMATTASAPAEPAVNPPAVAASAPPPGADARPNAVQSGAAPPVDRSTGGSSGLIIPAAVALLTALVAAALFRMRRAAKKSALMVKSRYEELEEAVAAAAARKGGFEEESTQAKPIGTQPVYSHRETGITVETGPSTESTGTLEVTENMDLAHMADTFEMAQALEASMNLANADATAKMTTPSSDFDTTTLHAPFLAENGDGRGLHGETTVSVAIGSIPPAPVDRTMELPLQESSLDYTLIDLESSETHVNMPSGLTDAAVFTERRTNIADVLKQAIERAPDRLDLRMKLLELYHTTAHHNREGFIEAAKIFTTEPNYTASPEWAKVAAMGRQIAPEEPMFFFEAKSGRKLADCA